MSETIHYKRYKKQQRAVGMPALPFEEWAAEVERGQANAEAWDELIAQQEEQEREGRQQIVSDHALADERNAAQAQKRQQKFSPEGDAVHNNEKALARREKVRRRLGGRR